MTSSKNVDYLSRLPPELLEDILNLAHDHRPSEPGSSRLGCPPSRYFRPFFDRVLYTRVVLRSYDALWKFCHQVRAQLHRQVRSLTIEIPWIDRSESDYFDPDFVDEEEEDHDSPSTRAVAHMLKSTDRLQALEIQGSSRLALLVLSSTVATSSLPELRSLSITSTLLDFDDPFHPAHYSLLACYTSLRTFALFVVRARTSISSLPPKKIPSSFSPIHTLRKLALKGPILASTCSRLFLASLPPVSSLSLKDSLGKVDLLNLVQFLPDPAALVELKVDFYNVDAELRDPIPVPTVSFEPFVNLRSLSIEGVVDLTSPSFYHTLCGPSSLEHLLLGTETASSTSGLSQLVDFVNLQTLVLDHLHAVSTLDDSILWRIRPDYDPAVDFSLLPVTVRRAEWPNEFSKEGFRKLVEKCKEKGIKITGSTLRALEIEDRFDSGELEQERIRRLEERKNCEGGAR